MKGDMYGKRIVHTSERAVMLELRKSAGTAEHVFINPHTGKPYTDVKRAFASACEDAGIVGLRWHDLRHTFGTRMAEAGYSEATIAELMGHCDTKTTRRYTHATDKAKRAAVEAVRLVAKNSRPIYAPKQEQPPKVAAVNG